MCDGDGLGAIGSIGLVARKGLQADRLTWEGERARCSWHGLAVNLVVGQVLLSAGEEMAGGYWGPFAWCAWRWQTQEMDTGSKRVSRRLELRAGAREEVEIGS